MEIIRRVAERVEIGRRPRGRPKKKWIDCVKEDGRVVDLDMVEDMYRIVLPYRIVLRYRIVLLLY